MATTTTTLANLDSLTVDARRDLTRAYAALAALEPTPARIRRAATAVGKLRAHGLSVRGVVAALSCEGHGSLPTGKGTVERMGYVADAAARIDVDAAGDAVDAIFAALYRVAQLGKAADVARAADAAATMPTGDDMLAAITGVRDELNAKQHKGLTTPPARSVAGEAADGGKTADQQAAAATRATADDVDTDKVVKAGEALRAASTAALLAELTRRVSARAFTPDGVLTEAFEQLAAQWEAAAERADATADA